ncbi:MAG: metallophosphoesterase [Planctomycetes bacterium]|nr:metallophosphoesterase [Planctomycetota bacterium]
MPAASTPPSISLVEPKQVGKVLHLPASGRAIVCTDLHGNLPDFLAVVEAFRQALVDNAGDAYLLITGDLVHGPRYSPRNWPEHLGSFYRDQTEEVLDSYLELREEFPQRVFTLIGNHEHSHIGGPDTRKFHKDPSETEFLEATVGAEKTEVYKAFFRTLPITCIMGKGVIATHGAPRVLSAGYDEVSQVEYGGHDHLTVREMLAVPVLGELFWARNSGPLAVRRFLRRMEVNDQPNHIVIYGHDPVRKGYLREGDEQLCFSTSFGLKNEKKVYLELDLTREYKTVRQLRYGIDIIPLYPDLAAARRRRPSSASG